MQKFVAAAVASRVGACVVGGDSSGGMAASVLTVDKAPTKASAYTNQVYLHPSDFAAYDSEGTGEDCFLLLLRGSGGEWIFMASSHPAMTAGKLGVASIQRQTAGLEIDAAVEVEPFSPTPEMGLGSLRCSVAPFKAGSSGEVDAQEFEAYFLREYGGQTFAVGQRLAVGFRRVVIVVTVEGLEFGVGGKGGGAKPRFGQVLPRVTQVLCFKERGGDSPNFKLVSVSNREVFQALVFIACLTFFLVKSVYWTLTVISRSVSCPSAP